MAINPSKLLPTSALAIRGKEKTVAAKPKKGQTLEGQVLIIRTQVIKVEKLISSGYALKYKQQKEEEKEKLKTNRAKREEELEEKKAPKEESKGKLPGLPRLGFLDRIKNFIGNMLLAFFVVRLIDHLPKLVPFVKALGTAADFLIDVGGKLLNGLVTFVDWGYKAYDATRGFVKNLFGEDGAKQFDQLSGLLNKFLNLAIIAGMIAATTGGGGRSGAGADAARSRPGQGGKPKVTTSGGRGLGRPDIRNPLRQRPTVTTGSGGKPKFRLPGAGPKVTGSGAKGILSSVRPFLKRIPLPVVGALIDFGLSVALGENPGRAAFRAIGAGLLGAIGAAAGSVIPVAGNFIGGLVGGFAGDAIGGALYDMFFGGKLPSQKGKTLKKVGGGITRGGKKQGAIRRTGGITGKGKKKRKTKFVQKPREVEFESPGADIGGEEKLFGIFPNPLKAAQRAVDTVNPFKAIENTGKNLGKSDYFGPILAITSKITLGQKPSEQDYKNVGLGINLLFNEGMNKGQLVGGVAAAYAEGGFVDKKALEAVTEGGDITNWVAGAFKEATETNAQKTLREIKENAGKKKDPGINQDKGIDQQSPDDPNLNVDGGGFNVTGGNADFWSLVAIASLESGTPQGRADVAQSIYNRVASKLNFGQKSHTIKGHVIADGQYQPVGDSDISLWAAISDKKSAIAAVNSHKNGKGRAEKIIEESAAAIKNSSYQKSAAEFVGGRTDFWSTTIGNPGGIGHVIRHGHRFGWFSGPAAIAYGRKNPGPAKAPQLGDVVVMGGAVDGGTMVSVKGGKAFPLPKGMIGTGPGQVYGAPRDSGGHAGVDVVEKPPWGSNPRLPIVAYSGGKVLSEKFVPNDPYLSGLMIDHGGVQTRYLHATPNVRPGQTVQPGQKIGNLLDLKDQTHLHFEAYKGSQRLNPTSMLRAAYEKGGLTLGGPHIAMLGEKGREFVIDADSTAAIEGTFPGFLEAINRAKYDDAIRVLQNFASYEFGASETIIVQDNPSESMNQEPIVAGGSGMISGGGDSYDPFAMLDRLPG